MMTIAVSMRVTGSSADAEARDAISHDWMRFLARFSVTPILVPNNEADPTPLLQRLEVCGVLLTNGNDVGPQPREAWPPSASVAGARDRTERALLSTALERRLPVLGVCRGMQFINTYFGGSLIRDVAAWTKDESHVATVHRVTVVDAAYRQWLEREVFSANSFHNHGVTMETLAPSLRAIVLSDAGIVEGCYHPRLPLLGIQWHPERHGPDQQVAEAFVHHWLSWCQAYVTGVTVQSRR